MRDPLWLEGNDLDDEEEDIEPLRDRMIDDDE